jgi:hypothetical protein
MAGTSLLVLLDDIAAVLDDVALMTKVAAKKTAGVLGDDLAVNAEKVSGVQADRELPVVWAVAKGSFRNKLILVPAALTLSAVAPWAITPILMLGGLYLCYEGFEKVAHVLWHRSEDVQERAELIEKLSDPALDPMQYEKEKIKGAIRTDFILSLEIIVIALGIVAENGFMVQVIVISGIAVIMTVGVYGLVAGIVKLDDAGLYLSRRKGKGMAIASVRWLGLRLLEFAPILMKILTIVGTIAMFLVGGGILVHGFHPVQEVIESITASAAGVATIGPLLHSASPLLLNALFGMLAGALMLALVTLLSSLFRKGSSEQG